MPLLIYLLCYITPYLLALTTLTTAQTAILFEYSTFNSSCRSHHLTQTLVSDDSPQCIPVAANLNGNFDIIISQTITGINNVMPQAWACGSQWCGDVRECREMFGKGRKSTGCKHVENVWFWKVGGVIGGGAGLD